jgi:hypothetical protein
MRSNAENATDERPLDADRPSLPPDSSPSAVGRGRRAWQRIPAHWRFIGGLFVGAKVVLTLVGLMAIHANDRFLLANPTLDPRVMEANKHAATSHEWLSMWFAWDALNYWQLARGALFTHAHDWDLGFAFPPLYPLLGRGVSLALGGRTALALLLITNVAFVLLLYYAYRLGERLFGEEDAARRFTKYVVLMPAGFIFQAAFTESLFLCLVLASFYYAERGKWLLVGILGYFFALTRSYGFLVTIPLALILLQQGGYRLHPRALWGYVRTGWPLALVPAGWLTFMAYCRFATGDWFRYQHEQEQGWHISVHNPLPTLWGGLTSSWPTDRFQVSFAAACLVLGVIAIRYVKPAYAAYAVILIMMPLSIGPGGYQSLIRYAVVIFPVALVLAVWSKRREIDTYLTAGLALVQGALFVVWLNYWTFFMI